MARPAAALLLLALLLAGGCGFRPVHGDGGDAWLAGLRGARLEVPETAVGWQLARFLRGHQGGGAAPGAWRLELGLSLGRDDLLVQRDSDVIRGAVRLQGDYVLRDAAGAQLAAGALLVSAAYNRAGGGFVSEVALRNAETRAAREFAEQLWRRLLLAGAAP